MMRTVFGSAVGGAVAGAIALVASAQGRSTPDPAWHDSQTRPAYAVPLDSSSAPTPAAMPVGLPSRSQALGPVVQCGPSERAVVQRLVVDGREVAQLVCASLDAGGVPASTPYGPDIVERPVLERPVVRAAQTRRATATRREVSEPRRSWKKTALVIGGSAGAGAGVGALAGGKKGALIGAAIGGGAASIYEAVKR